MDPGRAREGAEMWPNIPLVEALKDAALRAEEAASRVEQHSMVRETLYTGHEKSPMSTAMTGSGSASGVKESQVFGHNQVALSAEETAAKVHAMVHQSMHTATELAAPSRKAHTNVDKSSFGGFDVRSDPKTIVRADSKAEAGAVTIKKHPLAGLRPVLITGEMAARMGPDLQSPHGDIAFKQKSPLNSIVPLTPDDSSEEHSQKLMSEPRVSSFDSDSRDSPAASTSCLGHTPSLFTAACRSSPSKYSSACACGPTSTATSTLTTTATTTTPSCAALSFKSNISSSKKERSRKQNLIDTIMRESQQPNVEAPVKSRKRGRPCGSKSSIYTKRSTGKLENGESTLSFPAGQHPQALLISHTPTQAPLIDPQLPSTVPGLPLVDSTRLEEDRTDASTSGNAMQSHHMSTSSTERTFVSEESVTKVPPITESQAQLAEENNLLKTLFKTEIGPIMDEAMRYYEDKLPRDIIVAVGKAFASKILNEKLRPSLRVGRQVVTPHFKQIAKATLQRMLSYKWEEREGLMTGTFSSSRFPNCMTHTPQGLTSASQTSMKHTATSGPPKKEEGRRGAADVRSSSVTQNMLHQSFHRPSTGTPSATETSGSSGDKLWVDMETTEGRQSVGAIQKDARARAAVPNRHDSSSSSSPPAPTPATEVCNDHRRQPHGVLESKATRVGKGDIWDRADQVGPLKKVEMTNGGDHSFLNGDHPFASSSDVQPHDPSEVGTLVQSAFELPPLQAHATNIISKYEGRSDEILRMKEDHSAVGDNRNGKPNRYARTGGRSPRPSCEAGFVSAIDTPLREPHQSGASNKFIRGRSTGADLPPPQQNAAFLPVSGSDKLVRARSLKRRHQSSAKNPNAFSLDGAHDASPVDKTRQGSLQSEALNMSSSGLSFTTAPQLRHPELASNLDFTLAKATDTALMHTHSGAVLNRAEDTFRPASQTRRNIYTSIEGDSDSRQQLASSRSQRSEGVSRPQRLQQETTANADDMLLRKPKNVNYVERPIVSDPDTDLDPIVPPSTDARRAKRADRSPSPPPDPTTERRAHYVPQPVSRDLGSILRHRELARGDWRAPCVNINLMNAALRSRLAQNLVCWRSWTGASKDIVTTAWAPNGSMYAVGASTEMDNLNIQYNRPNNLLLGDNGMNTLTELPDHYIDRPRPETIESGDNSLQDTYNAVDPELYTTVSHVCFGYESDLLFTASFDKTVKIWDVASGKKAKCVQTLQHQAKVELLSLGHQPMRILATGQRAMKNSIMLYDIDQYGLKDSPTDATAKLKSDRASKFKFNIYPTCLLFGPSQSSECLLLAGFSESRTDFVPDQEGDLVLWDVETLQPMKLRPSTQAVQDITWHPSRPIFAAATVPGSRLNLTHRRTQSVIRTYHPKEGPSRIMEYECPALDINDVRYNPFDDHYISAGCTNGTTYVWDERMPETILQKLRHGPPIDTLNPDLTREEQDTGVRFTGWSRDGLHLYTGSSDGTIKCWNIFVSPEDAFVRDVAQFDAGVMTGAFSPDQRELVVGLSKGSVHFLSSAPHTQDPADDADVGSDTAVPRKAYEAIQYVPAKHPVSVEPRTGVDCARDLLLSAQIEMHPIYGAGKGPDYEGPYAAYARPEGVDPMEGDLNVDILAGQLDPIQRKRGRRLGGRQDKVARDRYRAMGELAEVRNRPGWLREGGDVRKGGWMFEKEEVWWDVEAGDERGGRDGEGRDGEGREVKREVAHAWEGKEVILIDDD